MRLVCVKHQRVAVLERELLARERAARLEEPMRRRSARHGEHDVVRELGRLTTRGPGVRRVDQRRLELQVPVVQYVPPAALEPLPLVSLDLELFAREIIEVRLRRFGALGTAGATPRAAARARSCS